MFNSLNRFYTVLLIFGLIIVSCGNANNKQGEGDMAELADNKTQSKAENLTANIKTTRGEIVLELYGSQTPLTVANFVNLAQRGYYDGILFHRVIADFMIQGGDPTGTGSGGPGYKFEDEIVPSLRHNSSGILSMANAGPGTNGSQFFITHKATNWLDGKHTVFGKVVTGQNVVDAIKQGDKIETITISGTIPKEMKAYQSTIDEWNQILTEKFPNLKPAKKF